MISEKHHHDRLFFLRKIRNQLFQSLVCLFDQRQISRQRIGRSPFHGNIRCKIFMCILIRAVILHRHLKQKQRFICIFFLIRVDNLFHAGVVADILTDISTVPIVVNKLCMRKSQQRIYFIPLPARSQIRMHAVSFISQFLQIRRQRRNTVMNILLIGNAALRQKGHRIPCEKFKLRICRIAAADRYIQIPGNGIVSLGK